MLAEPWSQARVVTQRPDYQRDSHTPGRQARSVWPVRRDDRGELGIDPVRIGVARHPHHRITTDPGPMFQRVCV